MGSLTPGVQPAAFNFPRQPQPGYGGSGGAGRAPVTLARHARRREGGGGLRRRARRAPLLLLGWRRADPAPHEGTGRDVGGGTTKNLGRSPTRPPAREPPPPSRPGPRESRPRAPARLKASAPRSPWLPQPAAGAATPTRLLGPTQPGPERSPLVLRRPRAPRRAVPADLLGEGAALGHGC